jgi:hypothetical protein
MFTGGGFTGLSCYAIDTLFFNENSIFLRYTVYLCAVVVISSFGALFYQNISLKICKRLLCEINVLVILFSGLTNWGLDIFSPVGDTVSSFMYGFIYFTLLLVYIFTDAVKVKHRPLVIIMGIIFVSLTTFNIYGNIFGTSSCGIDLTKQHGNETSAGFKCPGIILADYGNGYVFYRRTFKRSIFIQIFVFSLNSVLILAVDKELKWMMFGTSTVPRAGKLGEMLAISQKSIPKNIGDVVKKSDTYKCVNPLNIARDEEENANPTTKSKNPSKSRNSIIIRILDVHYVMDEATEKRVKIAEKSFVASSCIGVLFFALHTIFDNQILQIGKYVCLGIGPIFGIVFAYKNVSFAVFVRLLHELNVLIIVLFAICNWVIEVYSNYSNPETLFDAAFSGFLYFVFIITFTFMDVLKKKSRFLVLSIGIGGALFLNTFSIINRVFLDKDIGVILLKYTIFDREFYFYKRSIQRSIFSQILCFCASAVYNLLQDKEMKLLMFGTGYVNRETGEAALKID